MPDKASTLPDTQSEESSLSPELENLLKQAIDYHDAALSDNTKRVYRNGWEDFVDFCMEHDLFAAPATTQSVVLYLTDRAERLSASTLDQRLAAIQYFHDQKDLESPTRSKEVRQVMQGIRRKEETTSEQAPPLLTDQIKDMVDSLPGTGPRPDGTETEANWIRGKRDRALLLFGYAGAFRRSELASLKIEDLEFRPDGVLVTVERSKTDQEGQGQMIGIRRLEGSDYCPVAALREWIDVAGIEEGPLFRGVPRTGFISPNAVTGRTVGNVVKRAAKAADLPHAENYTGHSLRAGHITQASMNDVPDAAIQAQSRHKSDRAFREYVRPQNLLENTSSAGLGL